jgi:hypothetical protein
MWLKTRKPPITGLAGGIAGFAEYSLGDRSP